VWSAAFMKILTLETTCDETAAAIVTDQLEVLASVVASQEKLHERYGGVVPELASRAHVERILPVIDETLKRASLTLADLDAVAVANTPGLAGSLLVGLVAAKSLCLACDLPLVAINHLQAHIYACRLAAGENVFPCIGLIVSGGHSSLYRCRTPLEFDLLGGTIDDAAGEAFDKVANLLGLPFPGGPSIERAARQGNCAAYAFPRPFLKDTDRLEFSFSGLKTAVRYTIDRAMGKSDVGGRKTQNRSEPTSDVQLPASVVADLAASFQEAVVDCLVGKALMAVEQSGLDTLCVGGGVAANSRLRERLTAETATKKIRLVIPPLRLCTDNAVMGAIAVERLKAGLVEDLSLDALPGLVRAGRGK
jgi:N6-L-threonylcarbamoyladenine synthase